MPIVGADTEPCWHRNQRRLRSSLRLFARRPALLSPAGVNLAIEILDNHHGSTAPDSLLHSLPTMSMMQDPGHWQQHGGYGNMQQPQPGGKGYVQHHQPGGKGHVQQQHGDFDSMQQQHGDFDSAHGGKGSWQQHPGGNGSMHHSPQQHLGGKGSTQQFGGNGSLQHSPQQHGGNGSTQQFGGNGSIQQPFGGKGSAQQHLGGNGPGQQPFGGKGSAPQLHGGNGFSQQHGGKGSLQQPFGGKGSVQSQHGGNGFSQQHDGKGSVPQHHGGNGFNQQPSGVYCVECNAYNTGSNQCWQCKSPLSIQTTAGKGISSGTSAGNFGKGSIAANQWAADYSKSPNSHPPNLGLHSQQASINPPISQPPQFVPPPKWCPQCGNQCMAHHAYCGMCYHQFFAKGSGKGGGGNNYQGGGNNYQGGGNNYYNGKGGGSSYPGNSTQPSQSVNGNQGGVAGPDYNLGGDRFTTELKAFPARIPRCFDVAFEMGNFTYTQSAPLEVQWRECSEYLSASKAMMAKINNFQAFLSNKETHLTSMALGAWQRRSFLMQSMHDVPQGAVNAHKVDVQQIHKLLGSLIPDNNSALQQTLQEVMSQIASAASPSVPVEQMTFEAQAREFLDEYDNSYMDQDDPMEIPQFDPVGEEYGPEFPEEFFDTPPLPKCRRLREKQPLPRGTAVNSFKDASEIAIHSSDSDAVNPGPGDVTPGRQSKAEKKEAKKARRAQALASSKSVIKSAGKR